MRILFLLVIAVASRGAFGNETYSCFFDEIESQNFTLVLSSGFPPKGIVSFSESGESTECHYVKTSTNRLSVICPQGVESTGLGFYIFLDLEQLTGQWTYLHRDKSNEVFGITCKERLTF